MILYIYVCGCCMGEISQCTVYRVSVQNTLCEKNVWILLHYKYAIYILINILNIINLTLKMTYPNTTCTLNYLNSSTWTESDNFSFFHPSISFWFLPSFISSYHLQLHSRTFSSKVFSLENDYKTYLFSPPSSDSFLPLFPGVCVHLIPF